MSRQQLSLVEFARRLSEAIYSMCDQHGEFYVAARRQYLRLDDSDLNKRVFPDLFGEGATNTAEPDDIFLYWLGDWPDACKACLDPGTAESVATTIYGKEDVVRLRADMARLKAVPEFPRRGSFQDIDSLQHPAFLRAVAKHEEANPQVEIAQVKVSRSSASKRSHLPTKRKPGKRPLRSKKAAWSDK